MDSKIFLAGILVVAAYLYSTRDTPSNVTDTVHAVYDYVIGETL